MEFSIEKIFDVHCYVFVYTLSNITLKGLLGVIYHIIKLTSYCLPMFLNNAVQSCYLFEFVLCFKEVVSLIAVISNTVLSIDCIEYFRMYFYKITLCNLTVLSKISVSLKLLKSILHLQLWQVSNNDYSIN